MVFPDHPRLFLNGSKYKFGQVQQNMVLIASANSEGYDCDSGEAYAQSHQTRRSLSCTYAQSRDVYESSDQSLKLYTLQKKTQTVDTLVVVLN